MKPPYEKSILNPAFVYTPSHRTNLSKTFARVRKEAAAKAAVVSSRVVVPIQQRKEK